jgi:hypothetical protein
LVPLGVDSGCPIEPAVYRYDCFERDIGEYGCPLRVSEAGKFTLLVYVLTDSEINRIFAKGQARTMAEEMVCGGDACAQETTGLYLSVSELEDPSVLRYWLYEGAGLDCFRPADALVQSQTPPPGDLNAPDWC